VRAGRQIELLLEASNSCLSLIRFAPNSFANRAAERPFESASSDKRFVGSAWNAPAFFRSLFKADA
jgi:hypothetical protein